MIELTENALVRGMGHANSGVNGYYLGLISRWLIDTYGVEPQQQASIDAGANKVLRIAEDGTRANGEYERIKIHVKGLEATLSERNRQIEELKKKVENNKPAHGELGGLRHRNAALYTTNKELSEAKGALQADNARLRAANTNLSSDNETLRADLRQARINRDFFFDRNKEKAKRINELTDKVNRLTSGMIKIRDLADAHAVVEVKGPTARGNA
ncbi:hypothetical protein [Brevibacterium moorei]|uniref:hypothetical protein n=1 Tax=Brevibacterium moorei TaxID=2968457 RepID=UPI00211C4DF4|nr:hypothetical protein [Brevibacterium sp. 68QC2CO]MCQ9385148.1 hypothetical protein [Brevibacterium sp. 68QC2CO]